MRLTGAFSIFYVRYFRCKSKNAFDSNVKFFPPKMFNHLKQLPRLWQSQRCPGDLFFLLSDFGEFSNIPIALLLKRPFFKLPSSLEVYTFLPSFLEDYTLFCFFGTTVFFFQCTHATEVFFWLNTKTRCFNLSVTDIKTWVFICVMLVRPSR
jgi:hypothetical protein